MTLLTFPLLIILFLVLFIYFLLLNPGEITLFYSFDKSITTSSAILVVGSVLMGLLLGFLITLYHTLNQHLRSFKDNRLERRNKEVGAIYREGVGRLLSGDIKQAHALLEKALKRDPSRVDTYVAMANVFGQEGEFQQAVNMLVKAKEIEPSRLEVLFKLATTYEEMGLEPSSIKAYEEILAIERSNRKAMRCLRDLHVKQGRWKEALEMQKRILKVAQGKRRTEEEEKMRYLRYEVARIAIGEGEILKAREDLEEIVRKSPDFVPARVSLGDTFKAEGQIEEATQVWKDGYQDLQKGVFLARLEDLYMEEEDPSGLLTFYRSMLVDHGGDLMLRLFFGKLLLRLEMVDEALEQLQVIEGSGVELPQLNLLLAEAHVRRKKIDEAIIQYKLALGVDSRLRFHFECEECGEIRPEWRSRCVKCQTWGNYSLPGAKALREAKPVELQVIHHGERKEWQQ